MRAVRTVATVVAAAVVLLASAPLPAAAHSALLGTTPADSAVVTTTIDEVTLVFNEPARGDFSTVAVHGPEGIDYADGPIRVVDSVVHQAVHPLRSGGYEVAWRIVSADGHPVSGRFSFVVDLPAALEPTAGPAPTMAARTTEAGWSWWWLAVAGGLAVAATLAMLAGRRRRVAP